MNHPMPNRPEWPPCQCMAHLEQRAAGERQAQKEALWIAHEMQHPKGGPHA